MTKIVGGFFADAATQLMYVDRLFVDLQGFKDSERIFLFLVHNRNKIMITSIWVGFRDVLFSINCCLLK